MSFGRALILTLAIPGPVAAAQADGGPISIYADRVLDGRGGAVRRSTVIIDNGRILRIEPRRVDRPTLEFRTGTLLPGLIDTHVHLAAYVNRQGRMHTAADGDTPAQSALSRAANAEATLAAGFTTVQSLGSDDDHDLRDWIARGGVAGPRVLTSLDPITDGSLTPEALRAEVARRVEAGADVIKLFASRSIRDGGTPTMTREQLAAACDEAKTRGVRGVVHAHSAESIRDATLAGCHQIEHGIFATRDVLELMAERGTYFDPQCSLIFRNYLDHRAWFRGIGNFTDEGFAAMERAIPLAIDVIRQAGATPGLKLVYGTDAVAGAHGRNAADLLCRVRQAGLRAADVIVSATSLAAESLGLGDQLGSLTPGYQADLIVVDGNPLDDIAAMTRVLLVVKGGRVVHYDPTLTALGGLR
ncbi:MAG: amidohydrolase family protein [Gemmatimonadales bacterium]